MRLRFVITLALAAASITVTGAYAHKKPAMTPMELQALQSREYQTSKDQVFASTVSVFQDLGYQIGNASMESGFITADSASRNKTGLLQAFAGMSVSGNTRATAFIETMPNNMTRVRLNFMNTKNSSSRYGNMAQGSPILDPQTYKVAFDKIEEALFERAALTKNTPSAALPIMPDTATDAAKPTVKLPVTSK